VKLLFDQNLSPRLVTALASEFSLCTHVREHLLSRAPDETIRAFARNHGFCLVTKDTDFRHDALLLGHPPKVIWLAIGNCTTDDVVALLRQHAAAIRDFDANPAASLMVITKSSAFAIFHRSHGDNDDDRASP
jgi:predicted nuclease of predicted toxin-antitoxin system